MSDHAALVSLFRLGLGSMSPSMLDRGSSDEVVVRLRRKGILWIVAISGRAELNNFTRDTAIDILSRFIAVIYREAPAFTADEKFISFAAAASLILAAKLHEGKQRITVKNFPHFNCDDLIAFETLVLSKIGFNISALATPYALLRHFSESPAWQRGPEDFKSQREEAADRLLARFYLEPESTFYAPTTLAIAALLLSSSMQQQQPAGSSDAHAHSSSAQSVQEWLASLPAEMLPSSSSAASSSSLVALDVDGCIAHLKLLSSAEADNEPSEQCMNADSSSAASALAQLGPADQEGPDGHSTTPRLQSRSPTSVTLGPAEERQDSPSPVAAGPTGGDVDRRKRKRFMCDAVLMEEE